MHFSVMLPECLEFLAVKPGGVYVDATAGLGGHTAAIAERLSSGLVIANDRDVDSLELARVNTAAMAGSIRFHHGPFSGLREAVKEAGVDQVDGLLADLGVSRYQLTSAERGFSIMADGPLDMRMDRSKGETASDIVNFYAEEELANLIYQLGEERRARQIARAIVRARPIRGTQHLAGVISKVAPRTGRLHPATQTFMALRMAVNAEQDELDALLTVAPQIVRPGGRIVVLTFMSLEDRRVKRAFLELAREEKLTILTKHVVKPSEQETSVNPASRSAKLRAVEMSSKD